MKLPKQSVLDYDKWICGCPNQRLARDEGNYHGKGLTLLLNDEGFMCCLGQFSSQAGVEDKDLLSNGEPEELHRYKSIQVNGLVDSYENDEGVVIRNTCLADSAMTINDYEDSTVKDKARDIKELFEKEGYEVELVNFPQ